MYLYHYYEKEIGPFKNLSDLPREEANDVIRRIKESKPHVQCASRDEDYMFRRRMYEDILRKGFIKKGGIMKKSLNKNHLVLITGFLYTITALIVVLSAWIVDLHRYDLRLTISRYVALRPWTAILYLIVALAMEICIFFYIKKTQMPPIRKIIYGIIFLCVLGCAVFPCNGHWSVLSANIHNAFAYGLMLVVTVSFITMLIMSKPKQHKIFSVLGICYATFFIVSYVIVGFHFFIMTLFIWENVFIYLLLIQLYLEKYND